MPVVEAAREARRELAAEDEMGMGYDEVAVPTAHTPHRAPPPCYGGGGGGARHESRRTCLRPVVAAGRARELRQHDFADAHAEQAREEGPAGRRRTVGQLVPGRRRLAIPPREVRRQRQHQQRVDGAQELRVAGGAERAHRADERAGDGDGEDLRAPRPSRPDHAPREPGVGAGPRMPQPNVSVSSADATAAAAESSG